ncbi:DNA-deoxyinosine glycosylase, partial [Campylobacter jejuni]|nr:DNA-deoxyinosine glycosylase [Campylobacter jejuni]
MSEFLTHPFEPFFDKDSKILILGSFPSVKSRQDGFYYQHPRNRFWPILETLFDV